MIKLKNVLVNDVFVNDTKYQVPAYGQIKVSRAAGTFQLKSQTCGLALKYVLKGKEYYAVDHQTIELNQGGLIILHRDVDYQAYGTQYSPATGLCIDINPNLLAQKERDLFENTFFFNTVFYCNMSTSLGASLGSIGASLNNIGKNGAQVIKTLTGELLGFSQEIDGIQRAITPYAKNQATKKRLIEKLVNAREYIHQHYHQKLTLDRLSLHVGLSKYYFVKLFTRCFGRSPYVLQEHLRMQKAMQLVEENNLRLLDIACLLGYTDLAAFSNRFKRYWHRPPSSYLAHCTK